MFVSCVCLCCAGSGLCDELITGSEESEVSVLNYV